MIPGSYSAGVSLINVYNYERLQYLCKVKVFKALGIV